MTRTKALLIVAPLALSLLVLLLLPLLIDKEKILDLASATIKEQTGATLVVGGDIGLQLFPRIGVTLADVSLTMPEERQAGLQIKSLELGLQLLPLFSGRIEIASLKLDGLTSRIPAQEKQDKVDTGKMSDQELDAFYAQRRKIQAEAGSAAGSQAALALPLALNVKTLKLTNSTVELLNTGGAAPTVIELRDVEANDLNLDARPIGLQARVRLPGEPPIELTLRGTVRVDQQRQVVVLDTVELEIAGATAQPITLQAQGEADLNRQLADLQVVLQIAQARGEGKLRYAGFESPLIDADLHFNLLDPALLALAGPEAAADAGNAPVGGEDPLPLAGLRNIDTRADLTIDKALLGGHAIDKLELTVRAVDGVIHISSLTGVVHGGQLAMEGTFNARHNTATLATTGTLAGLDIADTLAATAVAPVATGKASLDWHLASSGRTQNELLAALNGPIRLETAEVTLQDIGIEGMLCQAVALTNQEALTATFPTSTRFQALAADIQLAQGKALLNPLRAELAQLSLRGAGAYELISRDFRATFKARLSPELETLDHACRVSKRLTAIDWPVDCAGNANGEPGKWCKVDTEEIIKDLGKHEVQRKIEKKAGKLLDKLFGN